MIFSDACIFQGEKGFVKGSFSVADGRILQITPSSRDDSGQAEVLSEDLLQEEMIPLEGKYILPGLVDIHTHGNSGCDFSDADKEGLIRMGKYLAYHGITSFAPTSMTLPYEKLKAAFLTAAAYMKKRPGDGARIAGVHMEGPFFSEKKKGAQNSAFLKLPDSRGFLDLQDACGESGEDCGYSTRTSRSRGIYPGDLTRLPGLRGAYRRILRGGMQGF